MLTNQQVDDWVAALRSGDYEQGTGALCRDGKYCCLGVLARAALHFKKVRSRTRWGHDSFIAEDGDRRAGYLGVLPQSIESHLAGMNDGRESFDSIADWIEENRGRLTGAES